MPVAPGGDSLSTAAPRSGLRATFDDLGRAQKDSRGAPLYSRVVNRPLGRAFAALAFRFRRTPTQVTLLSATFSGLGIGVLALARPTVAIGILVSLCLVLGYALDAADGQLARLTGTGSAAGEWLDHMADAAKLATLHAAVLITFYRHFDLSSRAWLLLPLGYAAIQSVHFFGMILTDLLVRERSGRAAERTGALTSPLLSVAKLPTDYGLICAIFCVLGIHSLFFTLYGLTALAWALYLPVVALKWYRAMIAL